MALCSATNALARPPIARPNREQAKKQHAAINMALGRRGNEIKRSRLLFNRTE